jgi:hypothetical protein
LDVAGDTSAGSDGGLDAANRERSELFERPHFTTEAADRRSRRMVTAMSRLLERPRTDRKNHSLGKLGGVPFAGNVGVE